jgi:hypothetical protein
MVFASLELLFLNGKRNILFFQFQFTHFLQIIWLNFWPKQSRNSLFKRLGKTFMEYWMKFCKYSTGTSLLPSMTFEINFHIAQFGVFGSASKHFYKKVYIYVAYFYNHQINKIRSMNGGCCP